MQIWKKRGGAEKQYGGMGESIQYKFETNYVSFLKWKHIAVVWIHGQSLCVGNLTQAAAVWKVGDSRSLMYGLLLLPNVG